MDQILGVVVGGLHLKTIHHNLFGSTFLKILFNRVSRSNWWRTTVDMNSNEAGSYESIITTGLRVIFSMKKGDKNYWIVDTGISENILSSHYSD